MDNKQIFGKALHNFIRDFASGDDIRHLADKGYTVAEIAKELDYPLVQEKIGEIVWQHYVDTGKICVDEPVASEYIEKVTYEKRQGSYGRISMKKVVKKIPSGDREYMLCDYGKRLYKDREKFLRELNRLDERDREYIIGLPWPLKPVYHEADERMRRINDVIKNELPDN